MGKIILEEIVAPEDNPLYSELPQLWRMRDIKGFSKDKELFDYQTLALKNIGTALYLHFTNKLKKEYYDKHGITTADKQLNRACFWMATGSGKTLVLIKTIEYLDYLMEQGLVPQKEIMLLLPREDLIIQFQKQIKEYNEGRSKIIRAVNLLDYENDKYGHPSFNFNNEIKVYYYRSDLMRNERKESIVNYESYLNGGEWYLFLDEAHRGASENSNLKFYVNELSKNGFLFNFSATFTDDIDIISTCYNFNLERFITAGYGKNIYISDSNYTFNKRSDEFTGAEKQKQVLKSFIIFTVLKRSRKDAYYHNPLMITLVNSVQARAKTTNSDLKMFCEYMLRIAQYDAEKQNDAALSDALSTAKTELKTEFSTEKEFQFGSEKLKIESGVIDGITFGQIRESAFNSAAKGNLEYHEGEKGKEILFKLASSSDPFALIKIGDTATFIKDYLTGYEKLASFTPKNYMREINSAVSPINILLGSRAFYEGWDSNRPNIINMVNIGKGDAQKFVPQSIGRGVRIQPDPNSASERKRLIENKENKGRKNKLLETLFIFPSDKKSIETILGALAELGGQNKRGAKRVKLYSDDLFTTNHRPKLDLLVPVYEEQTDGAALPFNIADTSKAKFMALLEEMPPSVFILQNHKSYSNSWSLGEYLKLRTFPNFVHDPKRDYHSLNNLVSDLRRHINTNEKVLKNFRPLAENNDDDSQNDIIHYKYIEVNELSGEEIESLKAKIKNVAFYKQEYTDEELTAMLIRREKTLAEITEMRSSANNASFKELTISHIVEHYYLPLIYSNSEKVDYINHIIKMESEKTFIENLLEHLKTNKVDCEWMFSKIDETLDKIRMPYLKDNEYHDFYPDFIFWLKKGDRHKIVFVDPKGGSHAAPEKKIDGFETLFGKKEIRPDIEMELKMIGDWSGGDKYKPYWAKQGDFSFFNFKDASNATN